MIEGAAYFVRRSQAKRIDDRLVQVEESTAGRISSVFRSLDASINQKMSSRRSDQERQDAVTAEMRIAVEELKVIATRWQEERFSALIERVEMIEMRLAVRNGRAGQSVPE